jgi:hypothetical protein
MRTSKQLGLVLARLLVVVLVFAQCHFCAKSYYLPDGSPCFECVQIEQDHSKLKTISKHGDCHDCCGVLPCQRDIPDSRVSASLIATLSMLPAILPSGIELPELLVVEAEFIRLVGVEACPTLGPPRESASRAPPVSLQMA